MTLLSEEELASAFKSLSNRHFRNSAKDVLAAHIAAQAAEIEALKHYKQKYTDGLRALSESEAAVRVLSEALTQIRGNVEHSNGENADDDLRLATASGIIRAALASLPSSAAANAESHRRMREALESFLKSEWMRWLAWDIEYPGIPYGMYLPAFVIAAQDALNPEVASAGKLHEELNR